MKKPKPFFKKCTSILNKRVIFLFFLLTSHFFSFACNNPSVFDLSGPEQNQLIDLILEFACEEQVNLGDRSGMQYHEDEGLHGLTSLLPWHGDFIAELENYLLNNGGGAFVPLPEWNPCMRMPNRYYDEDAVCPGVNPLPPLGKLEAPACRGFNGDTYSCRSLCQFDTYEDFLREIALDHNFVHNQGVGGSMSMPENAAGTAIFYPWHKFLDNIYKDYKNANFMDLEVDVEVIYDDCCEVKLSIPNKCCLSIESVTMEDATFISSTIVKGEGEVFTFKKNSAGTKRVVVNYKNECGRTEPIETEVQVNQPATVPSIPSEPPYGFEYVCNNEQPNCYDFKWIKCLKGLEISSSSFKLNVEVDGTKVCLTSIFPKKETVTLTVTPIGYCGAGEPQQWTIYVNDPQVCGNDGGHFRRANDADTETKLIALYPNPVQDELHVNYSLANETTGQLRVLDILGRVQYSRQIIGNRGTANISSNDFDSGIYYLLLMEGEKIISSQRFVKN